MFIVFLFCCWYCLSCVSWNNISSHCSFFVKACSQADMISLFALPLTSTRFDWKVIKFADYYFQEENCVACNNFELQCSTTVTCVSFYFVLRCQRNIFVKSVFFKMWGWLYLLMIKWTYKCGLILTSTGTRGVCVCVCSWLQLGIKYWSSFVFFWFELSACISAWFLLYFFSPSCLTDTNLSGRKDTSKMVSLQFEVYKEQVSTHSHESR